MIAIKMLINGTNISSVLDLFNFSLDEAARELENHLSKDQVFDFVTEKIMISLYIVFILTGMFFNALIISVIFKNNKLCGQNYPYIANLSFADTIMCIFCMPFTLMALLRKNWNLGPILCKLIPFVQGSTMFVASATIAAIAIDRQQHIRSVVPGRYQRKNRNIAYAIIAIWSISFILSFPVTYVQTYANVGLPGIHMYTKCMERWPWSYGKAVYTVITLVAQFLIPSTVLLVAHLSIESHLNQNVKRYKVSFEGPKEIRVQNEIRRNRKATAILVMISIVFNFTWMPFNVMSLIADFHPEVMAPQDLYLTFAICHIIAMTSATSNPILYGWFNSNIRKQIINVKNKIFISCGPCRKTKNDRERGEARD